MNKSQSKPRNQQKKFNRSQRKLRNKQRKFNNQLSVLLDRFSPRIVESQKQSDLRDRKELDHAKVIKFPYTMKVDSKMEQFSTHPSNVTCPLNSQ